MFAATVDRTLEVILAWKIWYSGLTVMTLLGGLVKGTVQAYKWRAYLCT